VLAAAAGLALLSTTGVQRDPRRASLVLSVSCHGTKTWRVLFYAGGKPRSRRIGTYPTMTGARRTQGVRSEQAIASVEAGTFKDVAEAWVREYVDDHPNG
jgi:hypothetical protein